MEADAIEITGEQQARLEKLRGVLLPFLAADLVAAIILTWGVVFPAKVDAVPAPRAAVEAVADGTKPTPVRRRPRPSQPKPARVPVYSARGERWQDPGVIRPAQLVEVQAPVTQGAEASPEVPRGTS